MSNDVAVTATPSVFAGAEIDEFKPELIKRFETLDDATAAAILSAVAPLALWPSALSRYANSGSFRSAESNFDDFIAPFQPGVEEPQLNELLVAVKENNQIWDAAFTSQKIANFLKSIQPRRPSDAATDELYQSLHVRVRDSFEKAWAILEQQGWSRPHLE